MMLFFVEFDQKNLWSMKVANNPTTMHKYKNSLVLNGWLMNTKKSASLKEYELLFKKIGNNKASKITSKLIINSIK